MSRTLKFGNVLTCEHVVSGALGKPTLVGVYAGDILIPTLPAQITMGIYVEHVPDQAQDGKLTLTLMLGKQVIGKISAQTEESNLLGIIAIPFVPLTITEDIRFKVVASCDGFKDKTIIDQKLSQAAIATNPSSIALPQPS